ncbi:hypothetical protein [Weissella minor]|uniref:hypothetical protein n=1 Tax=Weissella minor TaxID=1620 RepID=UPI003AF21D38
MVTIKNELWEKVIGRLDSEDLSYHELSIWEQPTDDIYYFCLDGDEENKTFIVEATEDGKRVNNIYYEIWSDQGNATLHIAPSIRQALDNCRTPF